MFKTNTIEDTEMIYSLLREKYPNKQIEIEYNDNTKEYTLINTNKEFIEDPEVPVNVVVKVIYGDSVTGDTPVLLKKNRQIYIETIESIFDESKKVEYPGFKIFDTSIRLEKEYSTSDYQVYSEQGWVNIKKVIRHKCDKKIYRVLTHTGCVDVSEDHSLLDESKKILKPYDCTLGTKLLHSYPDTFNSNESLISKDKAYIYGFFYGDGSCGKYKCPSGLKYSFALNNADLNVLDYLQKLLIKEYPHHTPVIYDTLESSGVYKLSVNNCKSFVEEYRPLFYDTIDANKKSDKYKKVPNIILNSNIEIIQSFFNGYWSADGCRKDKELIGCTRFDNKGPIGSAGLYYLMKKLGYFVSLNTRDDKDKIIRLTLTKGKQRKVCNQIKKIKILDTKNDYIYDIETDSGTFQAGIGNIIVKNTDSIFLEMKYNRTDFEKNRIDTFKVATICGEKLTNNVFKRPPIELEFEKVFQPFILLTKKRYIGKKFEDLKDPFKLKNITKSGIATTRRNYCLMVKNCYNEIIDCIFDENIQNSQKNLLDDSIEIYKKYLDRIDNYQIGIDDLIMSGQIAKLYTCSLCKLKCEWNNLKCHNTKCKTDGGITESPPKSDKCIKCKKPFNCVHTFNQATVNLGTKMLSRKDEANVNDRIPYLFIENTDLTIKKAELAEDPVYAKNNNLKLNRIYYTESLAKQILPFFKIVLNEHQEILDDIINYTNDKFVEFGAKKLKASDYKMIIEDEN